METQRGQIYLVTNTINNQKYIGATTSSVLKYIFTRIQKQVKTHPQKKLSQSIKQFGIENFKIEILEEMDIHHKSELKQRELFYIKQMKPVLNMQSVIVDYNLKQTCSCGGKYNIKNRYLHMKSKQHTKYVGILAFADIQVKDYEKNHGQITLNDIVNDENIEIFLEFD
jgi:group I intron endonuclease